MTKHYCDINIPAIIERRHVKTTCDLCEADLATRSYEMADVTIESKAGTCYPGSGNWIETSTDVCVTCFATKVKPALETIGLKFTETEVDF